MTAPWPAPYSCANLQGPRSGPQANIRHQLRPTLRRRIEDQPPQSRLCTTRYKRNAVPKPNAKPQTPERSNCRVVCRVHASCCAVVGPASRHASFTVAAPPGARLCRGTCCTHYPCTPQRPAERPRSVAAAAAVDPTPAAIACAPQVSHHRRMAARPRSNTFCTRRRSSPSAPSRLSWA